MSEEPQKSLSEEPEKSMSEEPKKPMSEETKKPVEEPIKESIKAPSGEAAKSEGPQTAEPQIVKPQTAVPQKAEPKKSESKKPEGPKKTAKKDSHPKGAPAPSIPSTTPLTPPTPPPPATVTPPTTLTTPTTSPPPSPPQAEVLPEETKGPEEQKPKLRFSATGRRKESVARVTLIEGDKGFIINHRPGDQYLRRDDLRMIIRQPFELTRTLDQFKVLVNVRGGGTSGQAGAIRLGIARALLKYQADLRPSLRKAGLLTRDPREKERKKFGRKGARRSFQYTKR